MRIYLVILALVVTFLNAEEKQCEMSKWDTFKSIMVEEMMDSSKRDLGRKLLGNCIQIRLSGKFIEILKSCVIKNVLQGIMMKMRVKGYDINPSTTARKVLQCKLKKEGLFIEDNVDKNNYIEYNKKIIDQSALNEETREFLNNCFSNCSDTRLNEGINSIKEIMDTEVCFNQLIIEGCEKKKKEPGMISRITRALIAQEPKCVVQIDQQYLTGFYKECLIESNHNWMVKSAIDKSNRRKYLKRTTKFHMKAAMYFIKAYLGIIFKPTMECGLEKAGFFNRTTLEVYNENKQKIIQEFIWENNEERDKVVEIMKNCNSKGLVYLEDFDQFDLSDPEDRHEAMRQILNWKKEQESCFMPQFIDICGFNNNIAKMLYPMVNSDFVEIFVDDMRKKKEARSLARLGSIFKNDIKNYMKYMKN